MQSIYLARLPTGRAGRIPTHMLELAILGSAEGPAHARLPALAGAGRVAGRLLARLLRFALPDAPAPRAGGRRRERRPTRQQAPGAARTSTGSPRRARSSSSSCCRRRRTTTPPRTRGSACASRSSSTCRPRPGSACSNGGARHLRGSARPPSRTRCAPRDARVDDYTHALMEHGRNATESDIAWLEGLILAEQHEVSERRSPPVFWPGGEGASHLGASQKGAHIMSKVRIAIVGVGNCASSLVQGLEYYKDANPEDRVPGLMHVDLGGYHVRDIEVVGRVRRGREEGRHRRGRGHLLRAEQHDPGSPTCPPTGVTVQRGSHARRPRHLLPGGDHRVRPARSDVAQVLRDAKADVLVCYLPVGSEQAAKYYAQCRDRRGRRLRELPAGFIASDPEWAQEVRATPACRSSATTSRARSGATITHRVLTKLFEDRGVKLNRTYQLNFGGNMDFMNMLERERLTSKKISKTQSVQSQLEKPLDKQQIHIGPSDHVPWLEDRKWAHDPARGPVLRRRAAQHRDEARGLGLPELGRHRHRRRALREARAGPRRRRSADRPERLLHEVARRCSSATRARTTWSRSSSWGRASRQRRLDRVLRQPNGVGRKACPRSVHAGSSREPTTRLGHRRAPRIRARNRYVPSPAFGVKLP